MSVSLAEERDRLQRQIEELEHSLETAELDLSHTSDSEDDDTEVEDVQAGALVAQRERVQREIVELETALASQNAPGLASQNAPGLSSEEDEQSSSDESGSDVDVPQTVEGLLQMNLVYQQVLQDSLNKLEHLLKHNSVAQAELVAQMSGSVRECTEDSRASSYQQPIKLYLGRFLKPYFKDRLTGLGPPANQETKERANRMAVSVDDKRMKIKRWEGWQKTLLIHAVARDALKKLIQPKLSRVDYLSQKLSTVPPPEKVLLQEQIDQLEADISLLRSKKEEELIGDRYDDHDWQKISNIDFEGTKEADDIRRFWQNFLHPSINKSSWKEEEVRALEEISRRHQERDWEAIAQELGTGRTAFMCLQTFQCFVSKTFKRSLWSHEEDVQLRELVHKMRIGNYIPYTQMSYVMEGRYPGQLMYRWTQVLEPSLRRGAWSKEEDQLLLSAVERHGEKHWWKVKMEVPGRTDGACRDRYHDCLKVWKRGAFDPQERLLLCQLVKKHGVGRWTRIAAEIPDRFDAQCLREWKKMSKMKGKVYRPRGGAGRGAQAGRQEVAVRQQVKQEPASSEEEVEEEVVVYMDSGGEEEQQEEQQQEQLEEEEEEQQQEEEEPDYVFPPLEEWLPAEAGLRGAEPWPEGHMVAPPPLGPLEECVRPVRCTLVGVRGRCILLGPAPRALGRAERHAPSALRQVARGAVCSLLLQRAARGRRPRFYGNKKRRAVSNLSFNYDLMVAAAPWLGHVLVPRRLLERPGPAHSLAPGGAGLGEPLPSTPVFRALLQLLRVDTLGCRDVITQRSKKAPSAPPPYVLPPPRLPAPNTVAEQLRLLRCTPRPPSSSPHLPPPPPHLGLEGPLVPGRPQQAGVWMLPHMLPLVRHHSPGPAPPRQHLILGPAPHRHYRPPGPAPPRQHLLLGPAPPVVFQGQDSTAPLSQNPLLSSSPGPAPSAPPRGQKRGHQATGQKAEPGGKRARTLSAKARALQEEAVAKAEARRGRSPQKPLPQQAPGSTMWVMTANGLVPLGAAPTPHLLSAHPPTLPKPINVFFHQLAPPPPLPCSTGPAAPRGTREALQFQACLLSREGSQAVQAWLGGRGGVAVPGLGVALPYLPPFLSSLTTLRALLSARPALTSAALALLPPADPAPDGPAPALPPDPPASPAHSPDPAPNGPTVDHDYTSPRWPAPSSSGAEVCAVRQLVAELFTTNPAYQMLKARFLSCFTLPALLATLQPITEPPEAGPATEEEGAVQSSDQSRGRSQNALLLQEGEGPAASHYSGIMTRLQTRPEETRSDQ